MGTANHYDHFLERTERIGEQQLEFAMALYYDPAFVRAFLAHYDIPDGYERVAVAIDAGPDSPHVVLARDGGFVTCLGRGMSIRGLYRIAYAEIHGHHRLHTLMLESLRRSQDEGVSTGQMRALIQRKNLSLSRRDLMRLEVIRPLIVDLVITATYDQARELKAYRRVLTNRLGKKLRRLNAAQEADVRAYWEGFFLMHHLSVLAATSVDELLGIVDLDNATALLGEIPWWTWREGIFGPCLRATWCAGRLGAAMGEHFIQWTRAARTPEKLRCGVACLMTIALASPEHYRSIERLFRGWRDGIGQMPEDKRTPLQNYQCGLATVALGFLDDPELAQQAFLQRIAPNYAHILDVCGLGADGPLGPPDQLEPLQALSFATLATDDIRANHDEFILLLAATVIVARAEISDLYAPRALTTHFPDWVPAYGIQLFQQHAAHRPTQAPVTADDAPGRNAPCPCDSGRKYKRCCLYKEA